MTYLERIQHLLVGFVNLDGASEEDRLWNTWHERSTVKTFDLDSLLRSDVRMGFKARAIIVLLAPDLRTLPFRWDDHDHQHPNYVSSDRRLVKNFPQELRGLVGELVCHNVEHALDQQDEKVRTALFGYNSLILQFLAMLPEDDDLADRLFSRYQKSGSGLRTNRCENASSPKQREAGSFAGAGM